MRDFEFLLTTRSFPETPCSDDSLP